MVIYLQVPARVILTDMVFFVCCEHNCLAKTLSINVFDDAESDTSVYHFVEDNRDDSESEFLSGQLPVSESSNSEISDFEDSERISETDKDHVQQNIATSFATSAEITRNLLDANQNNFG